MRLVLSGLFVLALSGCGGVTGVDCASRFSGVCYEPVAGARLVVNAGEMSGPGGARFSSMTGEDYNVQAKFTIEDGGSVVIVLSGDQNLTNAVRFEFTRTGNVLSRVTVNGLGHPAYTRRFATINANLPFDFAFDYHAHGHVVVDGMGLTRSIFDFLDPGRGRFWGVILDRAKLLSVGESNTPRHPGI